MDAPKIEWKICILRGAIHLVWNFDHFW